MEVGCPGTWRLGLTLNPGSKSTPKATSPACHT